jgi:hypothetical protein
MVPEKYNQEWFKERAFKSLKKIKEGVWDYSDSLLLYTSTSSEIYESLQEIDTPYFKLVTEPEHEYLQSIVKDIVDALPNGFEYIDLGPGTEHKEQLFFDELKQQHKTFTYVPVDISDHFLDLAASHAENQNIEVRKMKVSFEELPDFLGKPTKSRFVSLGLTFSNYAPQEIVSLLKNIAGENGFIFINAQMRDRIDIVKLLKVYQDDAGHLADEKLQLLGLNSHTDISSRIADDGFQVWCTVLHSNHVLKEAGVNEGDRLMVFQSLRYTQASLDLELKDSIHRSFDTGSSFIATLIRT